MKPPRYFVRHPLGRVYARYCLLADDGRTVIGTQLSRPDGIEVVEPLHLKWPTPRPAADVQVSLRGDYNRPMATGRRCTRCGEKKARHEFTARGLSGRLASWCRACNAARQVEVRRLKEAA